MKIDRISYSTSIQIHEGLWKKISWEAELLPGDDPETETETLKNRIEELSKKFGQPRLVPIEEALPVSQVDTKQSQINGIAEAINSCTTISALERFAPMVERENVDVLYEAYTNKKKELQ